MASSPIDVNNDDERHCPGANPIDTESSLLCATVIFELRWNYTVDLRPWSTHLTRLFPIATRCRAPKRSISTNDFLAHDENVICTHNLNDMEVPQFVIRGVQNGAQQQEQFWRCSECWMHNPPFVRQCAACTHVRDDDSPQQQQPNPFPDDPPPQQPTHPLVQDFLTLMNDEELSDILFVVEGERIPAHKVVLAARSQYFRNMLYGGMQESHSETIAINEISATSFRKVLLYLYSGELGAMSVEESMELLACTDLYQLDGMKMTLEDHIATGLSSETVLQVLRHGCMISSDRLKTAALDYILRNSNDNDLMGHIHSFPIQSVQDGTMIREVLQHLLTHGSFRAAPPAPPFAFA